VYTLFEKILDLKGFVANPRAQGHRPHPSLITEKSRTGVTPYGFLMRLPVRHCLRFRRICV
jgi:hypothetical protein